MQNKRVAIVGAGLGGLCAAIKLQEAGYNQITVYDQNPKVGGVWYENAYPGCACDVPVALYQFSFAQSINWTRVFPQQPEIQAYAEELVDRYQLRAHLRLSEGVASAAWDEAATCWHIKTQSGEASQVDILVAAMGQLNRPSWPAIEGLSDFKGPKMHSARWDQSYDWTGKRVGIVGAAASAVQIIPEVAKTAAHVSVFQRSPNWVVPRDDKPIPPEQQALMMTVPEKAIEMAAENRQLIYDNLDYFFWQAFQWTQEGRAAYTRIATDHLEAQVPDPELRKKLTPDYPVGCRRILISDDFYPSLGQDNVELVTDGIEKVTQAGIQTKDGTERSFDMIGFATGFETTGWKWSMDVIGKDGKSLSDTWGDTPEAYLGITVAGYPNLFVLYGPNTNLGHNSITFMIERQVGYMVEALNLLNEKGVKALAPAMVAQRAYNDELQKALGQTVWADPTCGSWYKTADGRITQNWASHTRAYADATKTVKAEDYEFAD